MRWDAANARARGLATRLLSRAALLELAAASSWEQFERRLGELDGEWRAGGGMPSSGGPMVADGPAALLRRVARRAAARLALLGRWLGPGRQALAVIFEDETRRALRVLLRGTVQGATPTARLLAAVPTPDLPERLLARLLRAESPAALATILIRAGHPAGRVLEVELRGGRVGLLALELALSRLFATRVTRHARGGGALVRRFTRVLVDLENAWALLLAPQWGEGVHARDLWLPGGEVLSADAFGEIAGLAPAQIRTALARRFSGSPVASVFAARDESDDLEGRALAALLAWLRGPARRDPLGAAPVLSVLLRIRAEARDLATVIAGLALGAPPPVIASRLVTS